MVWTPERYSCKFMLVELMVENFAVVERIRVLAA